MQALFAVVVLSCWSFSALLLALPQGSQAAGYAWEEGYGELLVRTPTMASGYLRNRRATNAAFLSSGAYRGFYRTGDIVQVLQSSAGIPQ